VRTVRPLIGLSGRRKTAGQIIGTPENLRQLEGDWYYADYARGVYAAGGLPVNLPLDIDPAMFVDRLDGVLLSGGADVAPDRYAAAADPHADAPEPERDEFELALLDAAVSRRMPVLGICRGLQVLNVHAGGTLHQDVPEHARYDISPDSPAHKVETAAGSVLQDLYGATISVNSLHHQTIDRLGANLVATATDADTVEGVEHTTLPIIAVQWHPEMQTTRDTDPVFTWLVDTATNGVAPH